jgi:hypothetical protein
MYEILNIHEDTYAQVQLSVLVVGATFVFLRNSLPVFRALFSKGTESVLGVTGLLSNKKLPHVTTFSRGVK